MTKKLIYCCCFFSLIFFYYCGATHNQRSVPSNSFQMVLVLTDSFKATKGMLFCFERNSTNAPWILIDDKVPVVLGRNGLAWGSGLHDIPKNSNFPVKIEGDGKSPAGIFRLGSVFGYKPAEHMTDLKMPYIHITDMIECIDDTNSQFYNQIVSKKSIDELEKVDWQSSEKMSSSGIYYELGVVVEHNCNPIQKGSGSCIFLHNWASPNETMAGCTAMAPVKKEEIAYWLDETKNPVLVQLTKELYADLIKLWELPELTNIVEQSGS